MTREELITKWLDNDLNPQELEAFKALEDYGELIKLSDRIQHFKAPDYHSETELQSVLKTLRSVKQSKRNWTKPLIGIAAAITLFFAINFYYSFQPTTVNALASEKTKIELPDASNATLNAASSLTYNKNTWTDKREIQLEGEAFFKVAKGSKFDVITDHGTISVLGTQFNVKQRDDVFEVVCYEGLVAVKDSKNSVKLKPGDSYLIRDGKLIAKEKENKSMPSWLNNESYFVSVPFKNVLAEFERQYNVKVNAKTIDSALLYTGNFSHDDLDLALKSITLPLNLKYSLKNDSTIVLSRE